MKIIFFDTKSYDKESFTKELVNYPDIEVKFLKTELTPFTAELAHGYDAVCAFVSADISNDTIEVLNLCGVKLILLRCAGFNNVDLDTAKRFGIRVLRVPSYSPEAVAEHAMALALAVNRRLHKAYVRVRENDFSLNGLMGFNFYQKTAGIVGTGKIGAAMAKISRGFGMKVLGYDQYHNPDPDALIARPNGAITNGWTTDFYYKNTVYLRLKNAALGYSLPKRIVSKIGISKLRIYVAGTNLFTLSNISKYGVDPEIGSSLGQSYPQQYTVSIGCNLVF